MIYEAPENNVEIADTDVTSFVLEHASEHSDKPALIDGPSGRELSYGELVDGVKALAAGLAARGFGKGDVLAVFMPNLPSTRSRSTAPPRPAGAAPPSTRSTR